MIISDAQPASRTHIPARNLSNLTLQTFVTRIIAVGMLMTIVSGSTDLSVGSVLGWQAAKLKKLFIVHYELLIVSPIFNEKFAMHNE